MIDGVAEKIANKSADILIKRGLISERLRVELLSGAVRLIKEKICKLDKEELDQLMTLSDSELNEMSEMYGSAWAERVIQSDN